VLIQRKKLTGISFVEMVIAIVILGIIICIGVPSYLSYMLKSRRNEAKVALLDLATRMERYYSENNNSYASASITGNLGLSSATTTNGNYTLSIPTLSATTYTLQATPAAGSAQANDTECGNFTLTQAGVRGISGTGTIADCWGS